MTVFSSTKQALACAARSAKGASLGYRDAPLESWCPRCHTASCAEGHELELRQPVRGTAQELDEGAKGSLARSCMTRAGIELDGEDAAALYAWATASDEELLTPEELEAAALELPSADKGRAGLLVQAALMRRVLELQGAVYAQLDEAGLIRRRRPLKMASVGYRVHEDAKGRRDVRLVVDPHPSDRGVITGHGAKLAAEAIASGRMPGPVTLAVEVEQVRHPKLRAELMPRWERGEFKGVLELDAAIVSMMGWSRSWAAKVRASWGLNGSRGRTPTRAS